MSAGFDLGGSQKPVLSLSVLSLSLSLSLLFLS